MFGLGPMEMMIVLVIAVLLFGKRLPEVGRSLGKGLIEFKKGLNDIKSEVDGATYAPPSSSRVAQRYSADDHDEPTAPKFEPPVHEPVPTAQQSAEASENPTAQL
jgi:sec-independent protein translocase protein TatA